MSTDVIIGIGLFPIIFLYKWPWLYFLKLHKKVSGAYTGSRWLFFHESMHQKQMVFWWHVKLLFYVHISRMSTDVIIGIGLFPIILVTMRIQKFIEHLKIVIITFYDKHTFIHSFGSNQCSQIEQSQKFSIFSALTSFSLATKLNSPNNTRSPQCIVVSHWFFHNIKGIMTCILLIIN
jgi:hypothetical protein